ncbi:MAG: OmpA family protein [Pseudomonadota bacterium]
MRLGIFLFILCLFGAIQSVAQTVGTVNFDFDSDQLDAEARAELSEIAQRIRATNSYKPTVVVGHTDAVGTNAYNDGLGLRRARAVANELVGLGVPVDRIGTVESRGERELLVVVTTPERQNRRATVTLDDMLRACRSFREIGVTQSTLGASLDGDLRGRLDEAIAYYDRLAASGANGPAFQMAGAAREDCGSAVGYTDGEIRKVEYARRCICNSTRMQVALRGN